VPCPVLPAPSGAFCQLRTTRGVSRLVIDASVQRDGLRQTRCGEVNAPNSHPAIGVHQQDGYGTVNPDTVLANHTGGIDDSLAVRSQRAQSVHAHCEKIATRLLALLPPNVPIRAIWLQFLPDSVRVFPRPPGSFLRFSKRNNPLLPPTTKSTSLSRSMSAKATCMPPPARVL
jgi:hypothetical protein